MAEVGRVKGGEEVNNKRRVGMGKEPYKSEDITFTYNGKKVAPINAEDLLKRMKEKFKGYIKGEIRSHIAGIKKKKIRKEIWINVERERFHDLIKWMNTIQVPHLAVVSGRDAGDSIELIYHFSLFYGIRDHEVSINVKVILPKDETTIITITDILPGALITEREKQEMLGIKVIDIPDNRRVFTSEELVEGYYPWRNDNDPKVEKKMVEDVSKEGL